MSKQKREEEKKILAEMDEAMKAQEAPIDDGQEAPASGEERKTKKKLFGFLEDKTPENYHCHRCNAMMENGVCPSCGFRSYVPMNEKKQRTIRWVIGGVCIVAFVVFLIWSQMQ